ncbi:rhodanese-like domain-containing protein [bacterium]|nr:rhodanese-like domain-containing protein [bacterium]
MQVRRIAIQALSIIAAATVTAVVFNSVRAGGIDLIRPARDAVQTARPEAALGPVDLAGAKKLHDEGAIFVDARSESDFSAGHIKGALHVYYAEVQDKAMEILEKIPLEATVVAYCSGEDCHASDIVARELVDMGYEKVRIFFAGWPAWTAAGYPITGSAGSDEATPIIKPMGTK